MKKFVSVLAAAAAVAAAAVAVATYVKKKGSAISDEFDYDPDIYFDGEDGEEIIIHEVSEEEAAKIEQAADGEDVPAAEETPQEDTAEECCTDENLQ